MTAFAQFRIELVAGFNRLARDRLDPNLRDRIGVHVRILERVGVSAMMPS